MSQTVLQATIMISQIYEKYIGYLNTNQDCQAFINYYDLRERIVSGWIHQNIDEFTEIWEIVKYNEFCEFAPKIYIRPSISPTQLGEDIASVIETNQTEMTLSELDNDEMSELMEI
jgi:hypothetical protein